MIHTWKLLAASVSILLVIAGARASQDQTIVDYDPSDCTRSCQTDFSGESCWKRPFKFFVIDMVHSMQNYLKLVKSLAISDVDRTIYQRIKSKLEKEFDKLLNKTESKFEELLEPLEDNAVTGLEQTYQSVFDYIRAFSDQLYDAWSNSIVDSQVETFPSCPNSPCTKRSEEDPGNSDEALGQLRTYETLTYIFFALFCLLTVTYLLVYILLERFTILNYENFQAAQKALRLD